MKLKLIIGLGNPGAKYVDSRHNIGWRVLDHYHQQTHHQFNDWEIEPRFKAAISEGQAEQAKLLLVKPQTFMNLSGAAVTRLTHFYKLEPSSLLVIFDDADLEFGQLRLALDGGSGGHKGVESVREQVGSAFYRLKIGVKNNERPDELESFVLSPFNNNEAASLEGKSALFDEAFKFIDSFIAGQLPPRTTVDWLAASNS